MTDAYRCFPTITPPSNKTTKALPANLFDMHSVRQIQQPRHPISMPAALRPTEQNPRTSSTTTGNTSWPDSLNLPPVIGPPSTAHWKPDVTAPVCTLCCTRFTWFRRRHHCRRCGTVVCNADSRSSAPLDLNARFHPLGFQVRVCDHCAEDWRCERELSIRRHAAERESGVPSQAWNIPSASTRRSADDVAVESVSNSAEAYEWSTF